MTRTVNHERIQIVLRRHVGVGGQPAGSGLAVEAMATRFIIQHNQGRCIDDLHGLRYILRHLDVFP